MKSKSDKTQKPNKHVDDEASSACITKRKAIALDWLQKNPDYALSPPIKGNKNWFLFHCDSEKDREGKSLLEVIEKAYRG
jgi:hypothetical protein